MKITKLVCAVTLSMLFTGAATADIFTLFASKVGNKNCGTHGVYVGPGKAEEHGGYCLSILGENINDLVEVTYTEDKNADCPAPSGDNVYAGPGKSYEHGGVCLKSKESNVFFATSYTEAKRLDCPLSSGNVVYVGPHKEYEHGGTCLAIFSTD